MKETIKYRIRHFYGPTLQRLAYSTGLMQRMAYLRKIGGAIVLMYHSVADEQQAKWIDPRNHVPADVFAQQIEFLACQRNVISLNDLVSTLQRGETPPNGSVVITFDDGYIDNLTIAAPILNHYKLPATFFLPIGYIDRGESQWVDQAYSAFKYRTKRNLVWGSAPKILFDFDDHDQCLAGYQIVCEELLCADAEKRQILLTELYAQLLPTSRPPRLTMTWDDVQVLLTKYRYLQVGGHTMEHTDLTQATEEDAKKELASCVQCIINKVGIIPRHFSFCYGRTSEPLRQLVAESGFEAAFGACGNAPAVNLATDILDIPRVEAPASMRYFDLTTNVINSGFWRKLGR